jgi:hypothetical protein
MKVGINLVIHDATQAQLELIQEVVADVAATTKAYLDHPIVTSSDGCTIIHCPTLVVFHRIYDPLFDELNKGGRA